MVLPGMALAAPTPPPAPPAGSAPNLPTDAGDQKIANVLDSLREAGDALTKANGYRKKGNKSLAEQQFSGAELIVGPEVLAPVAPLFREGAPPRVTSPLKTIPKDTPAQPALVGNSEEDEPEPPAKGSLAGTLSLDGKKEFEGFGVVTLEPASGKFRKRKPKQRVMEQRDRQFAPRVMVVPVGSTVSFPNFDSVYHNVFSTSEAQPFDLGLYKNNQSREMTFEKEGILHLGCNLHANMSAHIVVVSAPHYAIVDGKGHFGFKSLEPGKYKLRAWSEKSLTPSTQEVTIKPNANTVAMSLRPDAPEGFLADKFGTPRGPRAKTP